MKCNNCGTNNPHNSKFCMKCGQPLEKPLKQTPNNKPKQIPTKSSFGLNAIVGLLFFASLAYFGWPYIVDFLEDQQEVVSSIEDFVSDEVVQNEKPEDPWILHPLVYVEITEDCIDEKPNYFSGFKYVYVFFSAENNTSEFSRLYSLQDNITIETEQGYKYDLSSGFIFAGGSTLKIPPGFNVRGSIPSAYIIDYSGGNYLSFKVSSTSSGYSINIPGYAPISLENVSNTMSQQDFITLFGGTSEGKIYNQLGVNCVRGNDPIQLSSYFPTILPASNFYDVGDFIPYGEEAEIQVQSYNRDGYILTINILYKNNSGGYSITIPAEKFVIGNDGYMHQEDYGPRSSISVGPNQQEVYTHTFNIPTSLRNIKLVFGNEVDAVVNID